MGYEKLTCRLGKWRRKSHDGFWYIHDTYESKLRDYEIEIECRVPIIKENQNGITYKRLKELKGCIRKKMQYQPCVAVKLRMQSPPLEKFCLIIDLNDNSSRWRRQCYIGIQDSKLVAWENNINNDSALTKWHLLIRMKNWKSLDQR